MMHGGAAWSSSAPVLAFIGFMLALAFQRAACAGGIALSLYCIAASTHTHASGRLDGQAVRKYGALIVAVYPVLYPVDEIRHVGVPRRAACPLT